MTGCKLISTGVFALLVVTRLFIQPLYSLISDCDETFNYWEPLNFLVRGFGKETWEYSPDYSIRSWSLLTPFYFILFSFNKIFKIKNSIAGFTLVRVLLATLSLINEWNLFREIANTLSLNIANIWLTFQLFNPGYFHASVELLPSSIAMILYLHSMKGALNYLSTDSRGRFIYSVTCNFIACMLGWPFVLVLSVPICIHFVATHRLISSIRIAFDCSLLFIIYGALIIVVDSIYYGKFTPVSWNILMYNVLNANEESGPNIFGTEPWHYYIQNLILNFPLPVLIFCIIGIFHRRIWPLTLSLALWVTIFITQPHKEERFMYPIYGLITLLASVGFYNFYSVFKFNKKLKYLIKYSVLFVIILQAISRITALVVNYKAPMEVYSTLNHIEKADADGNGTGIVNVCTGREWYRFPNSFFLTDSTRLRFVKSRFDGLLPGDFKENSTTFESIRSIPPGMNNMNQFDESKVISLDQCHYMIDTTEMTDPEYDTFSPMDTDNWEKIYCSKFIDAQNSKILGRAFTIPEFVAKLGDKYFNKYWSKIYGVQYIDYCLFERINEPKTTE